MEQTALRPKPMPGGEPGGGTTEGPTRRPHGARRRAGLLTTLLCGLLVGTVVLLSGVGLGVLGATVIGMSRLADLQRQAGQTVSGAPGEAGAPGSRSGPAGSPSSPPVAVHATLGLEAVDAEKVGALVVGVHVPGPGYAAGLVRGDVLLVLGKTRIDSAADLARAVAGTRPGAEVVLTVRHRSGGYQQLKAVPGVVT